MVIPYCLNIHPSENLTDTVDAIERYALVVKQQVAPEVPYPLGLRLSAMAANELAAPAVLQRFRDLLSRHALFVTGINGFPYGVFHNAPVKTAVYQPDWSTPERLAYTGQLAVILAALLPEGQFGNISTVPLGYKNTEASRKKAVFVRQIAVMAEFLDALYLETGRKIVLALEPEPDCLLESADETIAWFEEELLDEGRRWLTANRRRTPPEAEALLRRHIGVCLDTCHVAITFENPFTALHRFESAGIYVARIQLSAAIRAMISEEVLNRLVEFVDPIYLHQTKIRLPCGRILALPDLTPETLAIARGHIGCNLRTHFHVPLFYQGDATLQSTHSDLTAEFFAYAQAREIPLEIETYTFDVLPSTIRPPDVVSSLVREHQWVQQQIAAIR